MGRGIVKSGGRRLLRYKKLWTASIITLLVCGLVGCTGPAVPEKKGPATEAEVRAFTDPMLENILLAMGDEDYDLYTADFDEALKKEVTRGIFDRVNPKRVAIVGKYLSKKFSSMKLERDLISAGYFVTFATDENVYVALEIRNAGGKYAISKLSFASAKLTALGL
jgi:hypothetical protein